MEIPVLTLAPKIPSDGLPCLADWMIHASSIWSVGFEAWREALELKPLPVCESGNPMVFAGCEVVKGAGRASILLYTITYTYLKLKNSLSEEELQDFRRFPDSKIPDFRELSVIQVLKHKWVAFETSKFQNFQR